MKKITTKFVIRKEEDILCFTVKSDNEFDLSVKTPLDELYRRRGRLTLLDTVAAIRLQYGSITSASEETQADYTIIINLDGTQTLILRQNGKTKDCVYTFGISNNSKNSAPVTTDKQDIAKMKVYRIDGDIVIATSVTDAISTHSAYYDYDNPMSIEQLTGEDGDDAIVNTKSLTAIML